MLTQGVVNAPGSGGKFTPLRTLRQAPARPNWEPDPLGDDLEGDPDLAEGGHLLGLAGEDPALPAGGRPLRGLRRPDCNSAIAIRTRSSRRFDPNDEIAGKSASKTARPMFSLPSSGVSRDGSLAEWNRTPLASRSRIAWVALVDVSSRENRPGAHTTRWSDLRSLASRRRRSYSTRATFPVPDTFSL